MASKAKLVPSKGALRALRSLALSPHIALLGTVSSVCGLAAVHCHERDKLAVAERIIETKRTIHTISHGRGIQQVNRMFEAAERGDDFYLHAGRPMKPQKKKNSALVSQHPREDLDDYTVPLEDPTRDGDDLEVGSSDSIQQFDNISDQAYDKPSSTEQLVEYTPARLSTPADAADAPLIPQTYRNFARHATKLRQKKQHDDAITRRRQIRFSSEPDKGRDTSQNMTDLSPPFSSTNDDSGVQDIESSSALSSEESLFFNFVFGKQSHDDLFDGNVFQTMHPWEQSSSESGIHDSLQPPSTNVEQHRSSNLLASDETSTRPISTSYYIEIGAPVSEQTVSHTFESRFAKRGDHFLQVHYDNEPRYPFVFNQIAQTLHDDGEDAGLLRLEEILEAYVTTRGHDNDFTIVKLLIAEFSHLVDSKKLENIVRKVVRKCIKGSKPNLRTVGLLYPFFGEAPEGSQRFAYFFAMRYLEESCTLLSTYEEQKVELERIIEGTLLCKIPLNEQLLLPLLRLQYSNGLTTEAQALLNEMKEKYGIQPSFYSKSEMIRGYAISGNWWKVKSILTGLHAEDGSRKTVHGYATLFARALDEHMSKNSIESSCAFVMQTIKEAGLLPTSPISTRVILRCIRERRYDLLRQYVNMVQRDFPFVETGIANVPFASSLAATWNEMEATCEDIFHGCAAMAVNAIRDPFSSSFRGVVSEAIEKDISVRIKALEDAGSFKLPDTPRRPDVHVFVENIRHLVKQNNQKGFTPITRGLAEQLVQQTRAIMKLGSLLSGSYTADHELSEPNQQSTNKEPKDGDEKLLRLPQGLRSVRLPALVNIVTLLEKCYKDCRDKKLPPDHAPLRSVVSRLARQARHADAYRLMEAMYQSKWVQPPSGTPYDIDLFTQWLRLALQIRSGGKVKDVIWAVLETGDELQLTIDFLLVARMAVPKTLLTRFGRARQDDVLEAEYLRTRLKRRKAQQSSINNNRGVIFGTWKKMGRP